MMAEFQEVMRQWVRARKATKCRGEENDMLAVYPLEAYDDKLIAGIEERVMAWAAEHPEPVYPTWAEYLVSIGVLPEETSKDTLIKDLSKGMMKHVTADIAQKLGIEPKEG